MAARTAQTIRARGSKGASGAPVSAPDIQGGGPSGAAGQTPPEPVAVQPPARHLLDETHRFDRPSRRFLHVLTAVASVRCSAPRLTAASSLSSAACPRTFAGSNHTPHILLRGMPVLAALSRAAMLPVRRRFCHPRQNRQTAARPLFCGGRARDRHERPGCP